MGDRVRQWMRLAAMAQAVVVAAALAVASPTLAQTSTGEVYAPGDGSPNTGTLTLNVTATIQAACEFNGAGPSGSYAVPNLHAAWTNAFNFSINCTTPFRVGIVSANGALVVPSVSPPTGYSASAPYNVDLHLVGDSALSADSGLCDASNLLASAGGVACNGLRGPSSTSQGLRLGGTSTSTGNTSSVTVSAPAYAGSGLLVGSSAYADTLTVTISATT